MKTIRAFDIENIGPDYGQYFQGRGIALTSWDDVVIGIGPNAKEAYEDAVEMLAQGDWDVSKLPTRPRGIRKADKLTAEEMSEGSEINWYVAIFVK